MNDYLTEKRLKKIIEIIEYYNEYKKSPNDPNNPNKNYNKNDAKIFNDFIKLLLKKSFNSEEKLLTREEIEKYLFREENNKVNEVIFETLKILGADLSEISFDGKVIKNLNFSGLTGVKINLENIPDKDLSNVSFDGVTLLGTLDNAIINNTNFKGYIGNLTLNPQNIRNKSILGAKLVGITVDGKFDGVEISGVDFSKAKGKIIINPQKIFNKCLFGTNLSNVILCGDDINSSPNFDGCQIDYCNFRNAKGNNLTINLDNIVDCFGGKLIHCDLTGVTIVGTAISSHKPKHCRKADGSLMFDDKGDDLHRSWYYDKDGNYVEIHLYESLMWDKNDKKSHVIRYIKRETEPNLKFNVEYSESLSGSHKK